MDLQLVLIPFPRVLPEQAEEQADELTHAAAGLLLTLEGVLVES